MNFIPVPHYKFRELEDISPSFLAKAGIELLLLDVDNTMSAYEDDDPGTKLKDWAAVMAAAGITLFIVSNNKGNRPQIFGDALGIPYIKLARKPSRRGIFAASEQTGIPLEKTALAGDQIYTDMLAARRSGITGILVKPIKLTNPLHVLRYIVEIPFRIWGQKG